MNSIKIYTTLNDGTLTALLSGIEQVNDRELKLLATQAIKTESGKNKTELLSQIEQWLSISQTERSEIKFRPNANIAIIVWPY